MIRKDDNDTLFCTAAAAGTGKVVLSKLALSVPIVQPNNIRKVNLYKSITGNNVIPVSFHMRQCETFSLPLARSTVWRLGVSSAPEKPLWVLVGLQTYPIHVFDVSKQIERLTGVVDLTVRMEFSANVPANMQACALVISD